MTSQPTRLHRSILSASHVMCSKLLLSLCFTNKQEKNEKVEEKRLQMLDMDIDLDLYAGHNMCIFYVAGLHDVTSRMCAQCIVSPSRKLRSDIYRTRHNSADSVPASNLVYIKEVAIRTILSIPGIIY